MPEAASRIARALTDPRAAIRSAWRRIVDHLDKSWFPYLERVGIHVKKVHFYSPIPDTRSLSDDLWGRISDLPGIDTNADQQAELAAEFAGRFGSEFELFPADSDGNPQHFYLHNGMYGAVDAEVLYGMIRLAKPRRVVEIGAGFSTLLTSDALSRNAAEGFPGKITCVEPCPRAFLTGLPNLESIIRRPIQEVPLSEFDSLNSGDVLFIDSTHVAKIGSDVCYEFLEVVPRLREGVLVHVHDIFFPQEYPRQWILKDRYFWNEQYILQAFLAFNRTFEVVWAGRYMHLNRPSVLEAAFPSYPHSASFNSPSSFWMRRVA